MDIPAPFTQVDSHESHRVINHDELLVLRYPKGCAVQVKMDLLVGSPFEHVPRKKHLQTYRSMKIVVRTEVLKTLFLPWIQ